MTIVWYENHYNRDTKKWCYKLTSMNKKFPLCVIVESIEEAEEECEFFLQSDYFILKKIV